MFQMEGGPEVRETEASSGSRRKRGSLGAKTLTPATPSGPEPLLPLLLGSGPIHLGTGS